MRIGHWLAWSAAAAALLVHQPALAQGGARSIPGSDQQLAQVTGTEGPVIRQIRIDGTQRIEPETAQSYLTVKPGDRFTAEAIDRSLKSLFATGLFADVVIGRDGDTLVVRLAENPIINRIAFEGNKKFEADVLNQEVQLRPRVVFTRTKVQGDVKRLLDLYRRNGRFAAQIEPKVIQLPQNRIDLVFEINEGDTTGISRITFIGNKRFSDGALRGELQTKETRWYRFLSSDDNYDPDRVTFDRELLRRFYLRNGYADFRVLSGVAELAPDRKSFFLTYTLDEGEKYKFGDVKVTTTLKNLDPKVLEKDVTAVKGEDYNSDDIEETIRKLTNRVGNLGYAFVEIEPVINRDRDKREISVTFEVREGPKVFVERIDIVGNVRTLDRVIRREFRLVEGDAFNTERLRRSERAIRDLGFFKKVEVTSVPGTSPDRTVLQAKIEEQSTGEMSIGGGFSSVDGALSELTVRERNLLGRGQDLKLTTMIAQKRQEFDISFTEPYFLDRNVSLTTDAFHITRDLQKVSSYDAKTSGGSLALGYQLNENLRHVVRYTLRDDEISNIDSTASRYIREQEGRRTTSMVGHDLTYNQLDSRIEPTDGYLLSFGNDISGLGGDAAYIRTRLKAAYYYPIASETVLSLRGEGGYIYAYSDSVRINERFFLGNDNLRGFARGGAGPRDLATKDALGANRYYATAVELSFPLGLPKEVGLSGRVFLDAGSSWDIDSDGAGIGDSSKLRVSSGVGLSWRSPFGPIRVDLGFPIMKESYDKTEPFRFSFGTKF